MLFGSLYSCGMWHHCHKNTFLCEPYKSKVIYIYFLSWWRSHKDAIKSSLKCQASVRQSDVALGWKPKSWTCLLSPRALWGRFRPRNVCFKTSQEHTALRITHFSGKWVYMMRFKVQFTTCFKYQKLSLFAYSRKASASYIIT